MRKKGAWATVLLALLLLAAGCKSGQAGTDAGSAGAGAAEAGSGSGGMATAAKAVFAGAGTAGGSGGAGNEELNGTSGGYAAGDGKANVEDGSSAVGDDGNPGAGAGGAAVGVGKPGVGGGGAAASDTAEPPPIADCGVLTLGRGSSAHTLPLRCVQPNRGVDDPDHRPSLAPQAPLKLEAYTVPKELRSKLEAYWMNIFDDVHGVLLLAPKGWIVRAGGAVVGANGSAGLQLEPPHPDGSYVRYFDNGGCQGCAVPSIGTYFPELARWAEEQGFTPDQGPDFANRTPLSSQLMAYTLKPDKDRQETQLVTDGVAYQQHDGGAVFQLAEVRLPAAYKPLAAAILNAYAAPLRE
ncbi:hypothetical protein SD70_21975 [Gordoniibacillus kamchatkensis]|uniref:DUF4850 domain-containing protein n=1 Tax=Gordoniibacillus kamchatkensis TaxID=1590651 RepID=A0ABR5ADJ7_9BACL|nr:DUF4850 domain-containing protein [Paenibacillus sp. VKM B-2647]KIL39106.1 hypothetical protein SD70_21975 [Paenibacillus sp. VKM B-2647]